MNEKQVRNAIRHESKKTMPFSNISSKGEPNAFHFSTIEQIVIYGKGATRTVAVRYSIGRKKEEMKLCEVSADADGYAKAAEMIEQWEDG